MSTESKLKRLGLWHLRDKPEELKKALEKITGRPLPKVEEKNVGYFHDDVELETFKDNIRDHFDEISEVIIDESNYWDFNEAGRDTIRDLYYEVLDAALQAVIEKHHPKSTLEFDSALCCEQNMLWNQKIELIETARMILESNTQRVFDLPDLLPRKVTPFSK